MSSANQVEERLGPETQMRTFQDILDLSLAMIEAQRTRVAHALARESIEGGLDKALSVEIKRLNAMLTTYNELVATPQPKAGTQRRTDGAISRLLESIAATTRKRVPKRPTSQSTSTTEASSYGKP
jgi:hypothetical protein